MIVFEFMVDENVLMEDLDANPAIEELAVLQETYFVFPTRLNVNGNEMFGLSKKMSIIHGGQPGNELDVQDRVVENYWLPLPLFHLVWVGFEYVRRACQGEEVEYSLPGTGDLLIFMPVQGELEVRSTLNGKVAQVKCLELLEAFEQFKQNVLHFIKTRVPEMMHHPDWLQILND